MATKKNAVRKKVYTKKGSHFQFRWWMAVILVIVVAVTGLIILRFSRASGGIHYLQNNFGGHNYGAAVMKDNLGEHYFWCGVYQYLKFDSKGNPIIGKDGKQEIQNDEVVYYQHRDVTGNYSNAYPTLESTKPGKSAGWENGAHMCDPTIVAGNFKVDGSVYKYALYYDSDPDNSSYGTKIGVAFTNNLSSDPNSPTKWKFINYPIICEYGTKKNTYGVGTASALIDPGDSSKVKMFFYDTSRVGPVLGNGRIPDMYVVNGKNGYDFGWGPNCTRTQAKTQVKIQENSDGVTHLGDPYTVSTVNTNNIISPGGDFAFDKENNWYYMVTSDSTSARENEKNGIQSFGEGYQLIVARIRPEALTDPTKGGWQILGYINSDTTKSYLNFNVGILRNHSGYLDGVTGLKNGVRILDLWIPQITPDVADGNNDTGLTTGLLNNLKIDLFQWIPGRVAINRYVSPLTEHTSTAGVKPKANYKFDNQTYYVLPNSNQADPNAWKPLYSCVTDGLVDYFLSSNVNCDGFIKLGIVGYSYAGKNPPNLPGRWKQLYRCWNATSATAGENFMTISDNCEGGGKPVAESYGWVSLDDGTSAFK